MQAAVFVTGQIMAELVDKAAALLHERLTLTAKTAFFWKGSCMSPEGSLKGTVQEASRKHQEAIRVVL